MKTQKTTRHFIRTKRNKQRALSDIFDHMAERKSPLNSPKPKLIRIEKAAALKLVDYKIDDRVEDLVNFFKAIKSKDLQKDHI